MDAALINAADSYDFAKGFFQPTKAEVLGSASEIQNFGVLLSIHMHQRFGVEDWDREKVDLVSYFMYFFLGMAASGQCSEQMRADFNIDKIFWRFESDQRLKMYVPSVEGSKKKLVMKCISFDRNKITEDPHPWTDADFGDIISIIGLDIKSYEVESHHYDVEFGEKTKLPDGTLAHEPGFFITAHYDRTKKIKPLLIKNYRKTSSSRLNEIKLKDVQHGINTNMDDFFDGMLSHQEEANKVQLSAKDFSSHVIQTFKANFKSALPEAHCGFMHGSFFPFQKKYDFLAEISQIPNKERPLSEYDIFLIKKFTSTYKRLLPDYPLVFFIVDTHPGMEKVEIEKRVLTAMHEHRSTMRRIMLSQQTLSSNALMTYLNFNAQTMRIAQNDLPTMDEKPKEFRKMLTEAANTLDKFHRGPIKANELEQLIKWKLEKRILFDDLISQRLCTRKSRCLSNYMYGMFSADKENTYIVKPRLETGEQEGHLTSFLLETDRRDLQILLRVHEYDYTSKGIKFNLDDKVNIPPLNKDSKSVLVVKIVVPYLEKTFSHWEIPNIETRSFVQDVNGKQKDFQIKRIKHLDLVTETLRLSTNNVPPKSDDEFKKFLKSPVEQFRNFEDMAAFAMGCFNKILFHTNIASPSPATLQIAYIMNPNVEEERMVVIANFMFGKPAQVDNAIDVMAKLHTETEGHKVAGKRCIVSYTVTENSESGAKEMQVFNEADLITIEICRKMKRWKRSTCKYSEKLERLKEQINPTEEKQEKLLSTTELVLSEKVAFFQELGKISHGVMTGLMWKSLIADFVQGNLAGLAVNVGFILGNVIASYGSSYMFTKAEKLTEEGRNVLGSAFKAGAPFLARSASFLFMGYDLYSNLHSNDSSMENKVAIGADITYLSLDLAETSIDLAEAFGVIEGLSAVGGPIMWSVGAAFIVGADIYRAVKQVEKITAVVPLTDAEKLLESLRAFIGFRPSSGIREEMALKTNEKIMQKLLPAIMNSEQIKRYVTPVQSPQTCSWSTFIDLKVETSKFAISPAMPPLPDDFSYFCSLTNRDQCMSSLNEFGIDIKHFLHLDTKDTYVQSHRCAGAVGILNKRNERAVHTYYQLTDGFDHVSASWSDPNIVQMGNGLKNVWGGDKDDIFLLIGNQSKGYLHGNGGSNLLSLARYKFGSAINITQNRLTDIEKPETMFDISNFDQIQGRTGLTDRITVWCSLKSVNMFGGGSQFDGHDKIYIPYDSTCSYNLTMTLFTNTTVINEAPKGQFLYHIQEVQKGHSRISLDNRSVTAEHVITFEYNFFDFSSVLQTLLDLHRKKLIFTMYDNSSLTIETFSLRNVKIAFKDNVQFHLHNEHLVAGLITTHSLTTIENLYAGIISASTMSMVIHSKSTNESLTLSRGRDGKHGQKSVNIHHSDADSVSHLKGNEHQNIFTISPHFTTNTLCVKFRKVSISVRGDRKNVINFMNVRWAVARLSSGITFKLTMKNKDTLEIHALYANEAATLQCDRSIGHVEINVKNSSRNIVLMNRGPLRLKFSDNVPYLESPPLYFNQSQNIIILSDHDIEEHTDITINKSLGDRHTFYAHNGTLLVTNVRRSNNSCEILENISKDSIAVLFMGYSSSKVLQSVVLKFNDVSISMKDYLERKFDSSVEFAAQFDLMKCIYRTILKLPVLATPITTELVLKEDRWQSGKLYNRHEEQTNRGDQPVSAGYPTQEPDTTLLSTGFTTPVPLIYDYNDEEGTIRSPEDTYFEQEEYV